MSGGRPADVDTHEEPAAAPPAQAAPGPSGPPGAGQGGPPVVPRARLLLLAACLGLFMSFIEVTAAISTLAALQTDLGVAPADLSWVSSTYTLVVAACVLSGGAFGERFGRRRVFLLGVLGLAAGSLIVATAAGYPQVLLGRAVSGLGGALVLPTSLAFITTTFFADLPRMLRYVSVWVSVSGIGLAVGPLLGGALLDGIGWQAVYLVNTPLAVVTVAVTLYAVRESKVPGRPLDLRGQLLAVVGLGGLVYGVAVGGRAGYDDPVVLTVLVVAAVALVALALVERRVDTPMLDVRMMRSLPYSVALVVSAAGLFVFVGVTFLEVLFLQRVQDIGPMGTGLRLLSVMGVFVVSTAVAQRVAGKVGAARLLVTGFALATVASLLLLQQQPDSSYGMAGVALGLLGLGCGLIVAPSTAAAFAVVEPPKMGAASSAVTAFRQVGSVLATAVLGAVMAVRFIDTLPGRLTESGVPDQIVPRVMEVARSGGGGTGETPPAVARAVDAAFTSGIHAGLWTVAAVSLAAGLLTAVFLVRRASTR